MASAQPLVPSGDSYLDDLRAAVAESKTTKENFQERAVALKIWAATLQQLGINLEPYVPIDDVLAARWSSSILVDYEETKVNEAYFDAVDEGFALLERLLAENGFVLPPAQRKSEASSQPSGASNDNWTTYQKDMHHTGYTTEPGPTEGAYTWKFPISLGWRARPVIEGDSVYVASPGMRVSMYSLDKTTGAVNWKCRREVGVIGDQLYHTPSIAASPVIVGNEIVVREIGSRGNSGWARHLVFIDKRTGEEVRKEEACHIDYRAAYAPFAANEEKLVYPFGVHDIERTPPIAAALDMVVCKDYKTGEKLWDYFVGPQFGEPLLTDESVFVGTLYGDVFCLKLEGDWTHHKAGRIRWHFKTDAAVNTTPTLGGDTLYAASNDGNLYALDQRSGEERWRWKPDREEARAFRLYSKPVLNRGHLFVGSADGFMYCLDAETGELRWELELGEWVRAAPVLVDDVLVVATLDGNLHGLGIKDAGAEKLWTVRVSEHHLLSDLVASDGNVYLTSSDLYIHCVDLQGELRWKQSLIEGIEMNGVRVQTDQIAGGAYYQSKPTAVGERAFIGTPSGFVHAIDERTGEEVWRFECGAAISAAPTYFEGRIYFGQQGGEDYFYCIDAETGQLVWKQATGWVWGSANAAQGRIFVPGIDGMVNCLDADTGAILWRYRTSRSTCSEPIVDGNTVYFGGWDHYFYAFDLHSGKLLWKYHVDGGCDSGTAVAKDGRVYLPSGGADSFKCLDGETGELLWEFPRASTNFNATPAFDGEHVYISINRGRGLGGVWIYSTICCLNAETGELVWEHEGGGLPGAAVAGDSVYFGSTSSPYFYCVDREPGPDGKANLKWKFNLTNKVEESTPAIINGKALVLSDDGYLYAIR